MRKRTIHLVLGLVIVALAGGFAGCRKKKKSRLTQGQVCEKGCEFRLACIEELELDKAVTEANRSHIERTQKKNHDRFLKYCVDHCKAGKKRLRGYADCGVKSKDCRAFFKCARTVEKAGEATMPARP